MKLLVDVICKPSKSTGGAQTIVLLVDQFPSSLGGGERVVLRTASLLQAAGYSVAIVTFQIFCTPETLESANCRVYLLPVSNVFGPGGVKAAYRLGQFLRRERVGVVITFFESANLFGGIVTKILSRAKLVWNLRDLGILRAAKHRWAYRLLPWLPDRVVAVSEQVRRHAINVDRIKPERVEVVYNGQDAARVVPSQPAEPPVVITVGNLRPVKGQDVLIEAAALVLKRRPDARFQLIGEVLDAQYERNLKERISELGIERSVSLMGGISEPWVLLSKASIFVLPSRSEGFSNSIVEAMLASLPVVATSVGGNAEAVLHEETGLIIPPDSPEEMSNAILMLLNSPDTARRMGTKGRERAEVLFTSEAMLRSLCRLIALVNADANPLTTSND